MVDEIKNHKEDFSSPITRDEIKAFTEYNVNKQLIDSRTGHKNLDFQYKEAYASEYTICLIMEDGSCIYLPITLTDKNDSNKKNPFLRRPLTEYEEKQEMAKIKHFEAKKKDIAKAIDNSIEPNKMSEKKLKKSDKQAWWDYLRDQRPLTYVLAEKFYSRRDDPEDTPSDNLILEEYITGCRNKGKEPSVNEWFKLNGEPTIVAEKGEIKIDNEIVDTY